MSAVAEETVEEAMLSAELWLSFASVVRSYAALAAVEVSARESEIVLRAGSSRLELQMNLSGGAGNWQLRSGEAPAATGRLEMLAEGRIAVDGKPLDLDHAAIDLVALVASAGSARNER